MSHDAVEPSRPASPAAKPALLGLRQLIRHCEACYLDFTPRSPEIQRKVEFVARVHQACMRLLREPSCAWEQMEQAFEHDKEQVEARSFCSKLRRLAGRRRSKPTPSQVVAVLQAHARRLLDLADVVFGSPQQRDLLKLDQAVALLSAYEESPERTFALLHTLAAEADAHAAALLQSSAGFCTLVRWGGTRFLTDFVEALQERFQITGEAVKDAAAQALARELGETESSFQGELEELRTRIQQLEAELGARDAALRSELVGDLVRTLQSRPNPVLDQVLTVYLRLQAAAEANELDAEQLNILIVFETLLEGFSELGIEHFPADLAQPLSVSSDQLDAYQYLEGSTFATAGEVKRVRCVRAGWRALGKVVTPACVSEIAATDEMEG